MRDQATEYASAWATFEALDSAAPHRADWASWAAGRGRHTLFMALVRDPPAVAAISDVQRTLAGTDGLELHQAHFFHISVQSCGFDRALPIDLDAVHAELSSVPRFEVLLGGVNAFHSAVFLETHSGGQLLKLRAALRRALGSAIETIDPHADFLFHLTIGYLAADANLTAVRNALRPMRARPITRITVDGVALIEVPTDQRVAFPELVPVRSFALAL